MDNRDMIGKTFALTQCRAEDEGISKTISGLYTVEEVELIDPATYSHRDGVWVFPTDDKTDEARMYFIEHDDFIEQIDPKSYGYMIEQERECRLYEEEFDQKYGHLFECDKIDKDDPDQIPF
jgi:hypothetical protein